MKESIEIRSSLKKLGIEVLDNVRIDLSNIFNDYVKNGTSATRKYRLDSNINVVVTLSGKNETESGITLERLT